MIHHALSLKQPWAALLAAGRKTVEVRRWATAYTGTLLIHAARIPDPRPEAWACVPEELREAARLEGGVVGVGTLTGCKRYRTPDEFVADRHLHLNDPAWFEERGLVGMCFRDLRPMVFQRVPGYVRIFEVALDAELPPVPPRPDDGGLQRRFDRLLRSLGWK